ncbi:hypothetical protein ETH_00041630, partial [Eimeria tenella]
MQRSSTAPIKALFSSHGGPLSSILSERGPLGAPLGGLLGGPLGAPLGVRLPSAQQFLERDFFRGPSVTLFGASAGGGIPESPLGAPLDSPLGGPLDSPLGGPLGAPLGGPSPSPAQEKRQRLFVASMVAAVSSFVLNEVQQQNPKKTQSENPKGPPQLASSDPQGAPQGGPQEASEGGPPEGPPGGPPESPCGELAEGPPGGPPGGPAEGPPGGPPGGAPGSVGGPSNGILDEEIWELLRNEEEESLEGLKGRIGALRFWFGVLEGELERSVGFGVSVHQGVEALLQQLQQHTSSKLQQELAAAKTERDLLLQQLGSLRSCLDTAEQQLQNAKREAAEGSSSQTLNHRTQQVNEELQQEIKRLKDTCDTQ